MEKKDLTFDDFDDTDKVILEVLQRNAKITIKQISDITGLSPTAIRARKEKLEGFLIKGYVTLLDCSKMGYREMVIAFLRINSSVPIDQIKNKVLEIDEIKFAYITTGDYPVLILAKCIDHSDSIELIEKLRNLEGVEEIKTQIVLDKIKEDPTVIIPGYDAAPESMKQKVAKELNESL